MIEVVTSANMALYQAEIDDMFKMRYRTAVDELGWKLPDTRNDTTLMHMIQMKQSTF